MKNIFKKASNFIISHPKIDLLLLFLGLVTFLTIVLINAPRASIWFDEAFSAYIAQFSLFDIARYTAADVHPPFYYWLLKGWSAIFGTTDFAYRALSAVLGAGVVVTTFFLTRKLFGRASAALALLFMTLSPMLIRYSDEARMYTLAALIVMGATYVMLKATETKSRKLWILYGVLVSLGMWTHYFTALAWVAHWIWRGTTVWRKGQGAKALLKKVFSKEWVIAYGVAVGLYLPWLPFMAIQLGTIQGGGFWIGPVTINSPANYFTNMFYYLERETVHNWLALGLLAVVILIFALLPRVYKALTASQKKSFILVALLTWAPPLMLMLASMPPLRSSFVERYLVPAMVAFLVFMAVILVVGTRRWHPLLRAIPPIVISAMMIFGITNVYYYGNFNKTTNYHIFTRQVIEQIHEKAKPGEPIVAQSPWVFYEAIPYATNDHPVYFIEATAGDNFGSLLMLQDQDRHKIKDITEFTKQHPVIWYIGQNEDGDLAPYDPSWSSVQSVSVQDEITGRTIYRATEFRTE